MSLNTLEKIYQSGTKLTPMMSQYYEIKKQHVDDIVFFRMGDFYEVFFEDAKQVSKILNIALTHRGKLGETPVPMAGIPHHAANNYIDKITEAGIRVAVCEQVQNPKDAVGIVKRAVTQVVSPGLPYDLSKVTDTDTFYIASISKKGSQFFLIIRQVIFLATLPPPIKRLLIYVKNTQLKKLFPILDNSLSTQFLVTSSIKLIFLNQF